MDLLIYVDEVTPRISYTFNHVFLNQLGLSYSLITSLTDYKKAKTHKFSYSKKKIGSSLFFRSHGLLFDSDIKKLIINPKEFKNTKVFFDIDDNASALPFDPFSCIFYMLSRYEEYISSDKDNHERYNYKNSISYKYNFLTEPIVEYWIIFIKDILLSKFPDISLPKKKFRFINSIDIDNGFAYLGKGFTRTIGGYLKSLLKFKFNEILQRTNVLLGLKSDPYDNFDYILKLSKKNNLKTIFFILIGNYSTFDRNIYYQNTRFRKLIKKISRHSEVGLHSSYSSNFKHQNVDIEKFRLENIIGHRVTKNRQHYIKINIPLTYQNLINSKIEEDFSMGYPDHYGFRAGTANSFYFFDLNKNIQTSLLIRPFVMMDVTFKYYLKLKIDEIKIIMEELINKVKQVDGCFVSIWHNETFNSSKYDTNWVQLYEKMISILKNE